MQKLLKENIQVHNIAFEILKAKFSWKLVGMIVMNIL